MLVGKASGKRTLADAMDYDIAARKKQRDKSLSPTKPKAFGQSRFFAGITAGPSASAIKEYQGAPVAGSSRKRAPVGIAAGASASAIKEYGDTPVAGPSRIRAPTAGPSRMQEPIDMDKENVPISDDDEDFDFVMIKPEDPVTQEDGYMSPSPSLVRLNTPDLSSPLRPGVSRKRTPGDDLDDFDVDPFSSPAAHRIAPLLRPPIRRLELSRKDSTASNSTPPDIPDVGNQGPDLRDMFSDDQTSDIDCFEDDDKPTVAPDEGGRTGADESFELDLDNAAAAMAREEVVAQGWWEKWGHSGKDREGRFHRPALVRRETNVTPAGRHPAIRPSVKSAPAKFRPPPRLSDSRSKARNSLVFLPNGEDTPKRELNARPLESGSSQSNLSEDDSTSAVKLRFDKFRCKAVP
ncbi:hypothetical protein FIBSPDRAFT_206301 [Athelia psychrophila]|uniref:Uncharacterized protein n=1 Tax=Athelia psychrophila TaxID=1759441 RepID=A0A166WIJ1_9AGAM|nr:hypothetical protein FIBSPDRAFT_206301 [Fibularhizoctonia sp. CBS 109695]